MHEIKWTTQAKRDYEIVKRSQFKSKVAKILTAIRLNPKEKSQGFHKIKSQKDTYARDINDRHRVVYRIFENEKKVRILSMWTHYESGKKL